MAILHLLLLMAVSFCGCLGELQQLTQTPDTPDYVLLANYIREHIKNDLTNSLEPLQLEIENVKAVVAETCERTAVINVPAIDIPAGHEFVPGGFTTQLEAIEGKLDALLQKTDALERKLEERTENLATETRITTLKQETSGMLRDTQELVVAKVDEVVETVVERVLVGLQQVGEKCGDGSKVEGVLENVLALKGSVEEVKHVTEEMQVVLEMAVKTQTSSEEVQGVKETVEEVRKEVGDLRFLVESNLFNITEMVEEISNVTQQLASSPPAEEQEQEQEEVVQVKGPVTPCQDSVFPGSRLKQICKQAVRFNKCSLPLVSYHCCQTCTSEGKIPEMGEWRYLNLPRIVPALQVIRGFAV